jgi:hypothetical protein
MSEIKKPARSVSDIQDEYSKLCFKAGHLQYQISALSKDLELLNSTMRDLNFEAAAAQAKAAEVAAAVAAAKAEADKPVEASTSTQQ